MKAQYLPHLAGRIFGVPLLIQPQKLSVILSVLGPRIGLPLAEIEIDGLSVAKGQLPTDDDIDEMDTEARRQKPYTVTPEGVAVISIAGTLVKKASWIDAMSGLQSYEALRAQLADARNDPRIRGILLDVESPGGEVGGLFDLADEVYAARADKPCYAIANDEAFSAAYALASSAEKVFVTRTGGVGSIGVIALHVDQSSQDEKMGRKYTAIFAGAKKNDFNPHEPLSKAAKDDLQGEIDRLYDMFVATVARNRELKPALIRNTEAGLFWGEKAVAVGLADQVGTYDDAVGAVIAAATERRKTGVAASAETQIPQGETNMEVTEKPTADASGTPAPAPVAPAPNAAAPATPEPASAAVKPEPAARPAAPVVDAAAIEAQVRAEVEEISALCTLAGKPDYLATAIKDKMTVAQVRAALMAAAVEQQQSRKTDSHHSGQQTTAEARLNEAATQIAQTRGISFAQAYGEALKLTPALYQQYLAERKSAQPN